MRRSIACRWGSRSPSSSSGRSGSRCSAPARRSTSSGRSSPRPGIVLLSGGLGGSGIDGAGVALALVAGLFWGAYILIGGALGRIFEGGTGLALAMAVATVLVAPFGIGEGGGDLLDPRLLALGAAVAILSSVIPYSFEFEALRRLPAGVFGVLMSLEPAVAAAIGFIALGQDLAPREIVAIGLVVAASAGALRTSTGPPPVEP